MALVWFLDWLGAYSRLDLRHIVDHARRIRQDLRQSSLVFSTCLVGPSIVDSHHSVMVAASHDLDDLCRASDSDNFAHGHHDQEGDDYSQRFVLLRSSCNGLC